MILSIEEVKALERGPVTVACKMEQPPGGYHVDNLNLISANGVLFLNDCVFGKKDLCPDKQGKHGCEECKYFDCVILSRHPHPKDSEVEVRESGTFHAMGETFSHRHACTARVTDVQVVKRDGVWVALTTVRKLTAMEKGRTG